MKPQKLLKIKERAERASGARSFRLHFNRVNMQRGLTNVWTVHMHGQCIPAKVVRLDVPVETVYKPNGKQPRAWFKGQGVLLNTGPSEYMLVTPYIAVSLSRTTKVPIVKGGTQ